MVKKTNKRRTGKHEKYWRTVYVGPKDRKTAVLRSPEGVEYRGTREEVSAAGLIPSERRVLAEGLRVAHIVFSNPIERRKACERRRRDAIEAHGHGWHFRNSSAATEVMIEAAARYVGVKVAELKRRAILTEIEAIIDANGELPLTRRERLAFEATGKRQSDFCCWMKLKEKLASRS